MDIISLSKANKAMKDRKVYQDQTLGSRIEAHFSSLDERLDWLDGTTSNSSLKEIINILEKDAILINTEFKDNKLQLRYTDLTHPAEKKDYAAQGIYEKIFDLSGSYINTLAATLLMTTTTNETVKVEYATSADGQQYTDFQVFNPAAPPSGRFLHIRLTLESRNVTQIAYDYPAVLEVHQHMKNNMLINRKEYPMQKDESWQEEGTLSRVLIDDAGWRRIDKIDIK